MSQYADVILTCKTCGAKYKASTFDSGKQYFCKRCSGMLGKEETPPATLPPEVAEALKHPSTVFGKYVLVREVGRGGMGVVYKA